jgi:cytochrome c556
MKNVKRIATAIVSLAVLSVPVMAQDMNSAAIGARQAHMKLLAYNISTLGGMAQGKIDYDAAKAQTAASNLAKLATIDGRSTWVAGSDANSAPNTKAKPEIWSNQADFGAKFAALAEATVAMDAAAGGGLDSLKGAIGALGGACGACHKAYRVPSE